MSIDSEQDLRGMEFAGGATRAVLGAMKRAVRPGVTTRQLDAIGAGLMKLLGAQSAPQLVYGFPGATCISVNEEVVHGVPGDRVLLAGDLVKLDVTLELNGYMADACETVAVGTMRPGRRRLVHCVERAFHAGLEVVKPGARAYEIGIAISKVVEREGFSVVAGLGGHGIGKLSMRARRFPTSAIRTARMCCWRVWFLLSSR
jgi:methionyl aminopeptidase